MKAIVANDPTAVRKTFKGDGAAVLGFSTILSGIPTLARVDLARGVPGARQKEKKSYKGKKEAGLKALAEAVILQSIEDLWSTTYKKESIEFFRGEGFRQCADAAGMGVVDRLRLIRMLRRLDGRAFKSKHAKRIDQISLK